MMRPIWTIARNDARIFLKDKAGYGWLFVMPLAFTFFFGIAMRGDNDDPSNPRPRVLIENNDTGYMGKLLIEEMKAQGLRLVEPGGDRQAPRGIRIPEDFTQKIETKQRVPLVMFKVDDSGEQAALMIEIRLVRAIMAVTSGLFSVVTEDGEAMVSEDALRERLHDSEAVSLDVRYAGRQPVPSGFQQSVPGYMVMFILMNLLMYGGISISAERGNGVIRRIAVHPITKSQLTMGKILGRFLLGTVQITFFLMVGKVLFGINYGPNLPLTILILCIYAWGCAALGVLIGAVVTGEDKVQGVCTLLSMVMAAMGGCWWPMELMPDTAKIIGHIFPTAWAMDAMHQLISFGGGFEQVGQELGVLAGFAIVSTLAAGKLLRY